MPTISSFYGILIRMYYNDHAPPHFHALYSGFEATIEIESGQVLEGSLPSRALTLVQDWAREHQSELRQNWLLAREKAALVRIDPLC